MNDRKREDTQPDYTLYQYTDGEGNPLQQEHSDGEVRSDIQDAALGVTF